MAVIQELNGIFKGRTSPLEDISDSVGTHVVDDSYEFVEIKRRKRGPNKPKAVDATLGKLVAASASTESAEPDASASTESAEPVYTSPMFRRR